MNDAQPTLLLTRPRPQSEAFLVDCQRHLKRKIPAIVSPLLAIQPVGEVPDLSCYDAVIVTSGNCVDRLGQHLSGQRVFTVGAKTADLARGFRADAVVLGENVATFVENADRLKGRALLCRGVHARGDLAENLRKLDKDVDEVVVYDQVSLQLTGAAQSLLAGETRVVAPLFSPRTAQLLSTYQIKTEMTVFAISDATRDAWKGPGDVRVAKYPDAQSMVELVRSAY